MISDGPVRESPFLWSFVCDPESLSSTHNVFIIKDDTEGHLKCTEASKHDVCASSLCLLSVQHRQTKARIAWQQTAPGFSSESGPGNSDFWISDSKSQLLFIRQQQSQDTAGPASNRSKSKGQARCPKPFLSCQAQSPNWPTQKHVHWPGK